MFMIKKLWRATVFSLKGLSFAWRTEWAFRFEIIVFLLLLPLLFIIAEDILHLFILLGSLVLIMVCELINTAIENLVDRVSVDYHELSEKIKDAGSASVFISSIFATIVWLWSIWNYFH